MTRGPRATPLFPAFVEAGRGGRGETIRARREVILAASSINSPKLLMLSGVGPAEHLAEHGPAVLADRPGVGANLQDHLEAYVQQACTQPITLSKHWNLLGKALAGAEWLLFKRGLGASNQFESAAFVRWAPGVPYPNIQYPDIQFHFLPIRSATTARRRRKATASRRTSGRCARPLAGR